MLQRKPQKKKILNLIRKENWQKVASAINAWHPADIADLIDNAPPEHRTKLFSLARKDTKPEILGELDNIRESGILEELQDNAISVLLQEMPPDDAADVLYQMQAERIQSVLHGMGKEEADHIRDLLKYKTDTAGGIMTTDVIAMHGKQTVGEALHAIAYMDTQEHFVSANIVDRENKLLGYVDLWELLREKDKKRPLSDLVHHKIIAADVHTDQEEVARLMAHYDLTVIPVVDEAGRLVGRITSDDVIDVMREEASEDIFRLAGSDDAELENASILKTCIVRFPWLMITLGGGFITTLIITAFHSQIGDIIILASFVPVILAMGGNTGIQSSTLIVRSIALGQFRDRRLIHLLFRQMLSGALMGSVAGIIIGIFAAILSLLLPESALYTHPALIAATVSVALFVAMTFAATFGALVPIMLEKIKVDPAVASGPFVTITNDIAAALIYMGATLLMIKGLS